jgi:hypothetical protein
MQEVPYFLDGFQRIFGSLAADFYAVAASDAAVIHHFGLPVDDLDGLYRTFPEAGITNPASVLMCEI